ncbi:hypothetical protein Nepgr_020280 [Nepenthes gracilis]|uniref:Uncharacterized protein n=1 Tax=Nepenthes gracilis TaxID=150966 RepID=A0AAD3SXC9_NEPGR|nr:hypothetical protein Nepgr_020280 [Nepenthes gracilis]
MLSGLREPALQEGLALKPQSLLLRIGACLGVSRGSSRVLGQLLLRRKLRTRLQPEGVNPALERSYLDAIRLFQRLASLEDSNFRVGVLDPRNSHARTREQLVDYHVPSSSTGHWDH